MVRELDQAVGVTGVVVVADHPIPGLRHGVSWSSPDDSPGSLVDVITQST